MITAATFMAITNCKARQICSIYKTHNGDITLHVTGADWLDYN